MRHLLAAIAIALIVCIFPSVALANIPGFSDVTAVFTNLGSEAAKTALAIIGVMIAVAVVQIGRGNAAGWWIVFGCIGGVLILGKWPTFSAYLFGRAGG